MQVDLSEEFSIGGVKVSGRLILGPMAGVTDLSFRRLCKEKGAALLYTEMISAKGIFYNGRNTEELLRVDDEEKPIALQLFGNDPELMAEMAKRVEDRNFDILDINMGCPVPKVVNNGEGSALLKNPQLSGRIISAVAKAIKKPVTVKIRKGFDDAHVNAVELARIAEISGAAAVAVHGRTREQYYGGAADWEIIRRVKDSVSIPVIGNGDVFCRGDALRMLEETGCDAVMIARGARGNPWIFSDRDKMSRSIDEVVEMILRHTRLMVEMKGEYAGIREMRKHISWYMGGFPHSALLRRMANTVARYDDIESLMTEYESLVLQ